MNSPLIIIIMGSPSDLPHVEKIRSVLQKFGIPVAQRVASAHKTPGRLLEMLDEYSFDPRPKIYLTVAGRSNALSGMVDANVTDPVIACPPPSAAFGGADLFSSLRMPSGVAPLLVLEPENAALAAVKILGVHNPALAGKIQNYQARHRERLSDADREMHTRSNPAG